MDELGLVYRVIPSDFEENHALHSDSIALVTDFAMKKAEDVLTHNPGAIVIGSDTIVHGPDGRLLGKAKQYTDAFRMIQRLQASSCDMYTGVAVLSKEKRNIGYTKATVHFKSLTDKEIKMYLDDPEADWMDKAGAFAVQGKAKGWIEKIDGEYSTMIGLSKSMLTAYLQEFGVL